MTARRLFATLIAATWLLPAALVGGVALHVALDHGHDHGDDEGSHDSVMHAVAIPEILEHGHVHAEDDGGHEHRLLATTSVVARTAAGANVVGPVADAGTGFDAPSAMIRANASPLGRQPRAASTPLLDRLSILRI